MLQFITDSPTVEGTVSQAHAALEGGCRWIQVRLKNAVDNDVLKAASMISRIAAPYNATVIIDDRVHLVEPSGATGVHLGKDDMAPDEARKLLPPGTIIGATINRFEDIAERRLKGADYYGAGPFRFTTTKQRLAPVLDTEGYRKLIQQIREAGLTQPVVAIGGITHTDVSSLLATGIDGIAVSGAISRAGDPIASTRRFLSLLFPLNS
ncbi:MAG: thiamine phosphate synthase [Muribaculaceae bacterium]|nr:thiamine phosphate synthase [Muribaculaceae bacterium]